MLWSFINLCAIIFLIAHFLRRIIATKIYRDIDITKEEDVRNKIVVITGSNAGIGKQAAYEFAARDGHVILACRDLKRAEDAVKWIRTKTNMGQLTCMRLDLGSLESIRKFVKEFTGKFDKLDILVNNAGVILTPNEPKKTVDGFEMQMGVNHLGHFFLTNLLLEPLKKAAPSRIIHVNSEGHKLADLDLDDFMSERKDNTKKPIPFIPVYPLYCRSKMAQVLFNHELADRLKGTGVNTYGLDPGGVATDIGRNVGWMDLFTFYVLMGYFLKTPKEGAATIMHCALNKDLANESGKMYQHCGEWDPKSRAVVTDEAAKKCWEVSAKYVGL